jgi:hypothetical protein
MPRRPSIYAHAHEAQGLVGKSTPTEPTVRFFSRMPAGYVFVPKGNVYITGNCRKRTVEAGKSVYRVVDKKKRTIGLRCPQSILDRVRADEKGSRETRANTVKRRDNAYESSFRESVIKLFPMAPEEAVAKIVSHALKKYSRRVGRSGALDMDSKARLAVIAHIRHCCTKYDTIIKEGKSKMEARNTVLPTVKGITKDWSIKRGQLRGTKENFTASRQRQKPILAHKKRTRSTIIDSTEVIIISSEDDEEEEINNHKDDESEMDFRVLEEDEDGDYGDDDDFILDSDSS